MDKFDALYNKVSDEFETYKTDLLLKSKKEIFNAAYKIGSYQELICMFENDHDWSDDEYDVFLSEEDLLATLYSEWLDCDSIVQDEYYECTKGWLEQILQSESEDGYEMGDDD